MSLPKSYIGGKEASGVYQTIINYIPPHKAYFEPFLGRGTILRKKRPAELLNVGIEINSNLYELWKKYCLENKLFYQIHNACGISYLQAMLTNNILLELKQDVYIYCDPTYLRETLRADKKYYPYELTRDEHIKLLDVCKLLPFNISISTYDNELYRNMLDNWNKITFKSQTRGGPAIETLYFNYEIPTELHDYNFLGEDFRERYRINQKINRYVKALKKLPILERKAILNAIETNLA